MENHLKMFQDHLAEIKAKEIVRLEKLWKVAWDPHSTADYKTAAEEIEKELQE